MVLLEFRAHRIQSYIFSTNRLKEMVGASAMIDQLTGHDIFAVIQQLGLNIDRNDFARCAGGIFLVRIACREEAVQLRDFWSLYVQRKVPGLPFSLALHESEAYDAPARAALRTNARMGRNRAVPALPLGSPFAARMPRSGLPAVTLKNGFLLDEVSLAKHRVLTKHADAADDRSLEAKLQLASGGEQPVFPLSFIEHSGDGEGETLLGPHESDQYIAVIHIDGNGLGDVVERIETRVAEDPGCFPELPAAFSNAVETATREAAREACYAVFKNGLRPIAGAPHKRLAPLRFLVLGGDDVTLVTKAGDALTFVRRFQEDFQRLTAAAFKELALPELPDYLTASAGVAFIKAKQPFHMAYHLAESLCKTAKDAGRRDAGARPVGKKKKKKSLKRPPKMPPATLAFHRITTAMIDDWETVVMREKTTRDNHRLTMQPYALAPDKQLPLLGDLFDLTDLLTAFGRGTLRELQKSLHLGEQHTRKDQRRLYEMMAKTDPAKLAEVVRLLQRLTGRDPQEPGDGDRLPLFDAQRRSPVGDALALAAVGDGVAS